MKKTKIAVIYGGPSAEHEVSVNSAKNVIKNLDSSKFDVVSILISKSGTWMIGDSDKKLDEAEGLRFLTQNQIDVVFILIHGEYGEDGTIQKLLEASQIKFIGTGSAASALAMDKIESSNVLSKVGLLVPRFVEGIKLWSNAAFPVVVKPTDRGSSVGVTIVNNEKYLEAAIQKALTFSKNVMIQDFIDGRELTCGVIERGSELIALVPTEIIPNDEADFFDYSSKYVAGLSNEITPPNLPLEMIEQIRAQAVKAHKALGCRHISRADFILSGKDLYVLEVNTLPGMTETSLLPQGARAAGLEFPELLETIIFAAISV